MSDVRLDALQALRDGRLSVDGALRRFRQAGYPAPSAAPPRDRTGHPATSDSDTPHNTSPWQVQFRDDLLEMVAGLLKVESSAIDLTTSVMDLGLDSLSAAEFNNLVRARFGIRMSPTIFFESNSVEDFCSAIVKGHEASIRSHYLGDEPQGGNGLPEAARHGSLSSAEETAVEPQAVEPKAVEPKARSGFDVERIWAEIAEEVAEEVAAEEHVGSSGLGLDQVVVTPSRGLPIEWFVGGAGDPLLLLGGLLNPPEIWQHLLPLLCREHRVLVFQPPGVGRSGIDREALTLDSIVEGLVWALDLLGVQGPVSVVGYSFGGIVAQRLCLRHPRRVAALVLLSSTAHFTEVELDTAALRDELLRSPEAQEVNRHADLGLLPVYHRAVRDLDERDQLGAVEAPSLVIVGAEDRYMRPELSQEIHRALARSEYSEVEGAGHLLLLTHPQVVHERVQRFLESRSLHGQGDR